MTGYKLVAEVVKNPEVYIFTDYKVGVISGNHEHEPSHQLSPLLLVSDQQERRESMARF